MNKIFLKVSFVFAFCLVLVIIISTGALTTFAAETNGFLGGRGTENDPYQISTENQLKNIKNNLSAYYILVNDIELSSSWEPIGTLEKPFTGSFDGNGHTIQNFKMYGVNVNDYTGESYLGFFGVNDGTICNLSLSGVSLTFKQTTNREGDAYLFLGGFAGLNKGTIFNCNISGNIKARHDNSYLFLRTFVGGICGNNTGSVSQCYSYASTNGSNQSKIGGICGESSGEISNCANMGYITSNTSKSTVGGICGESSGEISNCANMGYITTSESETSGECVIGLVGGISGTTTGGVIQACMNIGTIDMILFVGEEKYLANREYHVYGYRYFCEGQVGGIVGVANGESVIQNCYNSAEVIANITEIIYSSMYISGGRKTTIEREHLSAGGICGTLATTSSISKCYNLGFVVSSYMNKYKGVILGRGSNVTDCYHLSHITECNTRGSLGRALYEFKDKEVLSLLDFENTWCYKDSVYPYPQLKTLEIDDSVYSEHFIEPKEIIIEYNLLNGSNQSFKEAHLEGSGRITSSIPKRSEFVFTGWNTLSDLNKVYQPNDEYHGSGEILYAMWAPKCENCNGVGGFSQNSTCQTCGGDGIYSYVTRSCGDCYSTYIVHYVTGVGSFYYCNSCGSTNIKSSSNTSKCSNCSGGTITSSMKCTSCNGRGYPNPSPTLVSYSDSKVVLLNISGFEYSSDGVIWQDSNIFTELLPATEYTFYQRAKGNDLLPFGVISESLMVTTDKKSNLTPPTPPEAQDVGCNYVMLKQIPNCEYSIDGLNWQSSPLFDGLNIVTEYTFYIRYSETSTSYASNKSGGTIIKTDKGVHATPSAPQLLWKTYNKVVLVPIDGYEYSFNRVDWQQSNVFFGLDSNTNYNFYCRKVENEFYYTSAPSSPLNVKTEQNTGLTTPGDLDGVEGVSRNDAIYLLYNIIMGDAKYPLDQPCDFNGDGVENRSDAIYLLYHVILGENKYPLK